MKYFYKKALVLFASIFLYFAAFSEDDGILFQFRQNKGDAVSHIATVEEEAYYNGLLNNKTQFINRTSTIIKETEADGSALINTHYMTTQNSLMNYSGKMLTWGEEDSVNIHRKSNGQLYDSDNEFLPTVQSVPSFPDYKVKIGDSWTSNGLEVHNCCELFNMDSAITVPFTANYTYINTEEINGRILDVIQVEYKISQDNLKENFYNRDCTYAGTQGQAIQTIWWDNERGELDHYTEEFIIYLYDIYDNTYTFRGIAHGEVTDYKSVNDKDNVEKLQKKVEKYRLDNISIKQGDKGLTISLENIQFEPDSNILMPSEKKKLEKIGEILKDFSNDLLITGHCAARGSVSAQQKLSEERAESVASFLVEKGIRDEYHIFTQGKGAQEPIASNATEEGRIKNRRVEITIMD